MIQVLYSNTVRGDYQIASAAAGRWEGLLVTDGLAYHVSDQRGHVTYGSRTVNLVQRLAKRVVLHRPLSSGVCNVCDYQQGHQGQNGIRNSSLSFPWRCYIEW